MQLKTLQEEFIRAILNTETTRSFGQKYIKVNHSILSTDRLDVYRNNVIVGLTDVLKETFPMCAQLIGEETFKELAHRFIAFNLPGQACLFTYGREFPEFIQSFSELTQPAPYLCDVANYEWASHSAYYAPNEIALEITQLQQMSDKTFANFSLHLCDHVKLIESSFPLKAITDYVRHNPEEKLTYETGTYHFLIYRQQGEIREEKLSPLIYEVLSELQSTPMTIVQVTKIFVDKKAEENLGEFIQFLFSHSLIQQA